MDESTAKPSLLRRLVFCGVGSLGLYAAIFFLSGSFTYETNQIDRPLLLVLSLFAAAFVVYLVAIWFAIRIETDDGNSADGKSKNAESQNAESGSRRLFLVIVGFAIAFRGLLVFSEPIQEIDIYRYAWDGVVSNCGVSPFEYSPQEVLEIGSLDAAETDGDSGGRLPSELPETSTDDLPEDLRKLVVARDSSPAIRLLLERVHFGELPTVYPPVSQAVFALAARTTPLSALAATRINVMKLWLLLFDIGTVFVVAAMLRQAHVQIGWLTAYAWCPLVMKEFANSGHLDSIAVFLSSLAVLVAARAFFPATATLSDSPINATQTSSRRALLLAAAACVLLGLAVGAKLYPVVLVPLLALTAWKRMGLRAACGLAAIWIGVTAACLAPIWISNGANEETHFASEPSSESTEQVENRRETLAQNRSAGLKKFLSSWMMNDFIFLNIAENVTPDRLRNGGVTPWFVWLPDSVREDLVARVAGIGVPVDRAPFTIARTITATIFVLLALYFAVHGSNSKTMSDWYEGVFATMAWFWLLLPTLNPWYWIWSLPWLAFAKNRTWLLLSGLLFIYYLRFYFGAHFPAQSVVESIPYAGEAFFDFVVVWIEYLPWFVCLLVYRLRFMKD